MNVDYFRINEYLCVKIISNLIQLSQVNNGDKKEIIGR